MEPNAKNEVQAIAVELGRDIAQGLTALRHRHGWSRPDLADLMPGVTVSDLQGWETELRIPKGLKLVRVARLLGLDLLRYPADSGQALRIQRALRLTKQAPSPVIDISTLIIASRMAAGLTLKAFAVAWGVPTTTLQHWEHGTMPTGAHAVLVAERLGLPPSAVGFL